MMQEYRLKIKTGFYGEALVTVVWERVRGENELPPVISTFAYQPSDLTDVKVLIPLTHVRRDTKEPVSLGAGEVAALYDVVSRKVAERCDEWEW